MSTNPVYLSPKVLDGPAMKNRGLLSEPSFDETNEDNPLPQFSGAGYQSQQMLAQAPQAAAVPQYTPQQQPAPVPQGAVPALQPQSPTPIASENPRKGLLGRVHDALVSGLVGGAPAGYDQLLSKEQIQHARPSLIHSLIGTEDAPTPQARWRQSLDEEIALKDKATSMHEQERIRTGRESVAAKFPPPTSGAPADFQKWANQVYPALVALGDKEGVHELNTVMQQLTAKDNGANANPFTYENMGGETWQIDKATGQVVAKFPRSPNPRDPNAPDHAQELSEQRRFVRENQLTDDFNKDTKSQRESAAKIKNALSEADNAAKGDGAAQINLLYAFVNAMDPASAVREGEIGLARAATPVWQQAQSIFTKYMTGASVTVPPGMVKSMAGLMERRLGSYNSYIQERSKYYSARARKWGLDPNQLFPDLGDTSPRASTGKNPLLP